MIERLLENNLTLSIRHNSLYKKDICEVIKNAVDSTIEHACLFREISSDTVFYHLNKLTMKSVLEFLEKALEEQFRG